MRPITDTTKIMNKGKKQTSKLVPIQTQLEQFIIAKNTDDYHPNYLHSLIENGAILTAATAEGKPYIVLAAEHNRWDLVHQILDLDERADFSGAHPEGQCLLHILATKAHQDACLSRMMTHIFRNNPITEPDAKNARGFTPLHLACIYGNHEMVRELLLHGANPNLLTPLNQNCLHLCYKHSAKLFHHLLLRCGANPLQEDVYGNIPLIHVLEYGRNFPALQMLLTGLQLPEKYHARILFAACRCLNEDRVWGLLQRAGLKIDPNAEFEGLPLLHHAIRCRNFYLVNKLVNSGAFLHSTDAEGNTPLLSAIKYFNDAPLQLLRLLIDAGANPHVFNYSGDNAWDILASLRADDAIALQIAKFLHHVGVSLRPDSHGRLVQAFLLLNGAANGNNSLLFLHKNYELLLSPELKSLLLSALPKEVSPNITLASQWSAQLAKSNPVASPTTQSHLFAFLTAQIKQFLSNPKLAKLANQFSLF